MRDVLPSRSRPARTYVAIGLFIAVYAGVLVVVFAPRDTIAAQSGAVFIGND